MYKKSGQSHVDEQINQNALRETLEAAKETIDATPVGSKPKIVLKGVEAVHSTTYRYATHHQGVDLKTYLENNGGILPAKGDEGWWLGLTKCDDSVVAKQVYQLPDDIPLPKYRAEISTANLTDDMRVPYALQDTGEVLESTCFSNPQFGIGGGKQLLRNKQILVDRLYLIEGGVEQLVWSRP